MDVEYVLEVIDVKFSKIRFFVTFMELAYFVDTWRLKEFAQGLFRSQKCHLCKSKKQMSRGANHDSSFYT